MDWHEHIEVNPDVLAGKPAAKGTRLAVEFIMELLTNGWSEQEIETNYSGVTREDIRTCLAYAAEQLKSERVYPLEIQLL
jgi:uncharacterized protein (DUF433 family)